MKINKQEVIGAIFDDIDSYLRLLKNTVLDIYKCEWDTLFEVIYEKLEQKKITSHYYGALSALIADAFAKSQYKMVSGSNFFGSENTNRIINLYDILCSLNILGLFGLDNDDIEIINNEVIKRTSWGQVVDIGEYQKKKHLMK